MYWARRKRFNLFDHHCMNLPFDIQGIQNWQSQEKWKEDPDKYQLNEGRFLQRPELSTRSRRGTSWCETWKCVMRKKRRSLSDQTLWFRFELQRIAIDNDSKITDACGQLRIYGARGEHSSTKVQVLRNAKNRFRNDTCCFHFAEPFCAPVFRYF